MKTSKPFERNRARLRQASVCAGLMALSILFTPAAGRAQSVSVINAVIVVRADQPRTAVVAQPGVSSIQITGGVILWERPSIGITPQPITIQPEPLFTTGQIKPPVVPNVADARLISFNFGSE